MAHKLNVAVPANFWERLLDRIDPHATLYREDDLTSSVLAGRWLALRRLTLGMPVFALADRLYVDPDIITLIEVGLGTHDLMRPPLWTSLAGMLGQGHGDTAEVARILRLAVGQPVAGYAALVNKLRSEVSAYEEALPKDIEQLVESAPVVLPQPVATAGPHKELGQYTERHIFVLSVLASGKTGLSDIRQECKRVHRMAGAEVALVVQSLLDDRAIKHLSHSYTAHVVHQYVLTERGRQILREAAGDEPLPYPIPT